MSDLSKKSNEKTKTNTVFLRLSILGTSLPCLWHSALRSLVPTKDVNLNKWLINIQLNFFYWLSNFLRGPQDGVCVELSQNKLQWVFIYENEETCPPAQRRTTLMWFLCFLDNRGCQAVQAHTALILGWVKTFKNGRKYQRESQVRPLQCSLQNHILYIYMLCLLNTTWHKLLVLVYVA